MDDMAPLVLELSLALGGLSGVKHNGLDFWRSGT